MWRQDQILGKDKKSVWVALTTHKNTVRIESATENVGPEHSSRPKRRPGSKKAENAKKPPEISARKVWKKQKIARNQGEKHYKSTYDTKS